MRKYTLLWILIASVTLWNVIEVISFKVEIPDNTAVLKEVCDLLVPAKVTAGNVFSDHRIEITPEGIIVKDERPGETVMIRFTSRGVFKRQSIKLIKCLASEEDSDLDGYPDSLELNEEDSENFRNWFIWIAISTFLNQDKHPSSWPENEIDCSGFIRYCTREALRKHTPQWINESNYVGPVFSDVKKYNYPNIPLVKRSIFRVTPPPYNGSEDFAWFASARVLAKCSMRFVTKDVREALPGDIMLFFHPHDWEYPYHLMIYLGNLGFTEDEGWILYHTGPIGEGTGELRRVRYKELETFDPSWTPRSSNEYFLGFFRFNFLF